MQQAVKNTNSWLLRGYLIEVTGKKTHQYWLYKIHHRRLLEVWVLMLEYHC